MFVVKDEILTDRYVDFHCRALPPTSDPGCAGYLDGEKHARNRLFMAIEDTDVRIMITPSRGAHLVVPKTFLQCDNAIMAAQTSYSRVLLAIPWRGCVVVCTTATAVHRVELEPFPTNEEIGFLRTLN